MTTIRKPPRWCGAFLRALERGGDVRRAALEVGVDFTTAYARRKAHADFGEAWEAALAAFVAKEEGTEEAPPPSFGWSPSPANAGEELMLQPGADGARAARSGAGRWTAAAEKRFFSALADRANVRSAAAAAGFSTNAIYARRARRPEFRRQWEAAVETGKARLQMLLMDVAERAFDPDLLDVAEDPPAVSVAEALNILKAREGKDKELNGGGRGWIDYSDGQEEYQEACARIIARLERLKERDEVERTAAGWVHCPEHDVMIPPGWVRDPDYVAPPPEPENLCEGERLGLTYRHPSG
jgi:hypothetical protein